ncbi:protein of unknown function [Tenacibaculum sp. 190524A02b]|uniref:hypothetical protein n=1 Tax=Tenacibaculum vairaonense TaxID=3137860 RepID=UPI0032B1888C
MKLQNIIPAFMLVLTLISCNEQDTITMESNSVQNKTNKLQTQQRDGFIDIVYRSDSRTPKDIEKAGGFFPRKTLSIEQVRAHILYYCGANGSGKKPQDLTRLIISSPQPEYVSTALNDDTGGQHRGYLYTMQLENLMEVPFSDEVLGQKLNVKKNLNNPTLLLNAKTLAQATMVALKLPRGAQEVTFLTGIPYENIIKVIKE